MALGAANSAPQPPIPIETVELQIVEADPPLLQVNITGWLPSGCSGLGEVDSSRDGNEITIIIRSEESGANACTAIAQTIEQQLTFEGPFAPGPITVWVNGMAYTTN